MKRYFVLFLVILAASGMIFAGGSKEEADASVELKGVPDKIAKNPGGVKIAVIRNLGSDDHTNQFLAGAKEEGEALGFKVDTFITNGEDAKFQDFASLAMSQDYDGIILSHGKDPYATDLVKQIVEKGIAVSVFDTALAESISRVTATSQNDESLAEMSLGNLYFSPPL